MPRRNNRKAYQAVNKINQIDASSKRSNRRPECARCAFASYDVCIATGGKCLLGNAKPVRAEICHVRS